MSRPTTGNADANACDRGGGRYGCDRNVEPERGRTAAQKFRVGDDVERRKVQLGASMPDRNGKVGPDPRRLAERQCHRAARSRFLIPYFASGIFVFDHGLAAQSLEIAFGLRAEFLLEHLVADFLHLRRVGLGLLLGAYREHLHPLGGLLRRRQVTDRGAVEDLPQLLGEVGGKFRDLIAHGDVRQGARESDAFVAVLQSANAMPRPRVCGLRNAASGEPRGTMKTTGRMMYS